MSFFSSVLCLGNASILFCNESAFPYFSSDVYGDAPPLHGDRDEILGTASKSGYAHPADDTQDALGDILAFSPPLRPNFGVLESSFCVQSSMASFRTLCTDKALHEEGISDQGPQLETSSLEGNCPTMDRLNHNSTFSSPCP